MKNYRGYRQMRLDWESQPTTYHCWVNVEEEDQVHELPLRTDIRNHSPAGFEWGYQGSGPAQLALALVADCLGDRYAIACIYQPVKRLLVANLPMDGWGLTETELRIAIRTACGKCIFPS
jgi:hypothetical protein